MTITRHAIIYCIDKASFPKKCVIDVNVRAMGGMTRRKVATRTDHWLSLAAAYPTLPPPPPPEDEDLPPAKRLRLRAPSSIYASDDGVLQEPEGVATDPSDDSTDDTPTHLVTPVASSLNATSFRTPRIIWKPEEDAKLTAAVKKHGKYWSAVGRMVPGRTNQQCRGRWLNILDPAKKKRNKISWKPEEDAKLIEAVKKHGFNWLPVAAMVPNRTNQMCRQRWINTVDTANEKNSGKWTPEEDAKLIEAVKKHGKNWILVAAMIPGRTNPLCRQRWVNTVDPANKTLKGKWTPEEDAKLTEEVKKHGKDWLAVAKMVPGRSNLQCRRRWINTVDPDNKKNKGKARISWTPEEDRKLIEAVSKHGKHWVPVAALLSGRARHQCRERWVKTLDPERASNPVEEEHNAGVDEALDSVPK